jgi:hypothetical protein
MAQENQRLGIITSLSGNDGFSALPGGYGFSDGSFGSVGHYGNWWSASESENNSSNNKSLLLYVRCLQN